MKKTTWKKPICLLALLLLSALLPAGCGGKNEEAKEEEESVEGVVTIGEDGEWQGDTYVLKEYFFAFHKPENWDALLPSEIDDVFGEGSSEKYKMIVVNNTQQVIVSMFFADSGGLSQGSYMEGIQKKMEEESGVTYEFGSVQTVMVGDMEFSELDSEITEGGEEGALSNQISLGHQQGNRMLCINVRYDGQYEEVVRDMLENDFANSGM